MALVPALKHVYIYLAFWIFMPENTHIKGRVWFLGFNTSLFYMAEIMFSEYTIVVTYAYIDCALAVYRNYYQGTHCISWRFGLLNWYVMPCFKFLRLFVQIDGDAFNCMYVNVMSRFFMLTLPAQRTGVRVQKDGHAF